MVLVLLTDRLRSSVGLFHHAPCLQGRPAFGPSCTEFVYPGWWHFDNGAISKFDDVLLELGGLPHVLPLAVHLKFVWLDK